MKNVIDLAAYRSRKDTTEVRQAPTGQARIVEFTRPIGSLRDLELQMLTRALAALTRAKAEGDTSDLADWRDELETMAVHTDHFDIRERCKLALRAG
ncbi:hypothetical protein [Rhizobium leguminosarum]|uniref:hypothetical protein n=1 Tax=Rhizobium leguminosarum TaxID=384 RepID=UPI001AE5DE99|nr:hypothetical protein [Rhizobium leguminosarum]MBP2442833.1 hypothetical protein [Rhizobium leguminosarum]